MRTFMDGIVSGVLICALIWAVMCIADLIGYIDLSYLWPLVG